MTLEPGTRLGPYEVLSALGVGGMGEVYKARDTRLDRTVAIKILPETLAADPQFRERFDREARAISQLDHPHICTLYDVGERDGISFLVMQYLEGDTLQDRLAKGGLPLDQALKIAIDIASALDEAHRAGITHRDLKPGNIMLTKAGAKLLDFGLAKTGAPVVADARLSMLPTTPPHLTAQGMILGTFQYMAPEQLEGQEADARTDIFAFGAVVYEMLTGRKAFEGKSHASLIGAIMHSETPPISSVQPLTPPALDRIVRTCLAKDPDERWQTARDLLRELRWVTEAAPDLSRAVPVVARRNGRELVAWSVAAVSILAALAVGVVAYRQGTPVQVDAPEVRLQVITPPTTDPISLSLSPDGHRLVFVALGDDGSLRLWLRALDVVTAQPLAGTEGAIYPFWSPDSQSIGFFAQGKLKRIDIAGGQPQVLADAPGVRGGSWNRDGVILFSPSSTGGLFRVPVSGGDAAPVTQLAPRQTSHRFPQFLPDGRQFLYFGQGSRDVQGVYLGALDSPVTSLLTTADVAAMYASPGYILYIRQGALVARRFDAATGALSGDSVTVADPAPIDSAVNVGAFSTSAAGAIAHRVGGSGRLQLTWFDREGRPLGTIGPPDENSPNYPELSPDGHRMVIDRTLQNNRDVWLIDVNRGVPMRLTFDPNVDSNPSWSPDGSRIGFRSNRGGIFDLYQKPTGNGATETVLVASDQTKFLNDWSPDGRFLLYASADPKTSNDIWVAPLQGRSSDPRGDLTPFPFVNTAYDENAGQFSPDGRWVAYQSNESGPMEIYVQPFPGPGDRSRVSTAGGSWPRWRPDGQELFYVAPDGKLMAVQTLASGSTLRPGTPLALFQTRMAGSSGGYFRPQYDVAADGRFLINHSLEDAASPITVILNWTAALKK